MVPDQPFQPLLSSKKGARHTGSSERFLETCRKGEHPLPVVDRVCRRRRKYTRCDRDLHWSLARDVAIPKHDVVRIDEAGDHEERLAGAACLTRGFAQPADALARDEGIVLKAAPRSAANIPTRAEYVETVGLSSRAVVDRRLGIEDFFIHFELAEISGLVAKSFKH